MLDKKRFEDYDKEAIDLFIESIKEFSDRELYPFLKKWMKILLIIKMVKYMFMKR